MTDRNFYGLTPREMEVLKLIAEGLSLKEIAARLSITMESAKGHAHQIQTRLNIHKAVGLVRFAIKEGIVEA